MSSKRPNKPKHGDPLLLLCGILMVVYSFGCWARGYSYILSGSAMFPLAFPFTKRKFDSMYRSSEQFDPFVRDIFVRACDNYEWDG
jgi:hypothetical protein